MRYTDKGQCGSALYVHICIAFGNRGVLETPKQGISRKIFQYFIFLLSL